MVLLFSSNSARKKISVFPNNYTESQGGRLTWYCSKGQTGRKYLSNHAVPHIVDLLAMFSICDQVEVIGELDVPCYLLQNVNAETLAALLNVGTS